MSTERTRSHQLLAQVGLGDHERAQPFGCNQERFHVTERDAIDEGRCPRQLSDFGSELADTMLDERKLMAKAVAAHDPDCACKHNEHAGRRLASLEQPRAVAIA